MGPRPALQPIKSTLWVLATAGLVIGLARLATGLGATTNLTDALPWGLWKIFNMVGGAALATSGFVVAGVVYAFGLEQYRPIARLATLVAFLGYGSSLFALLFDLGLPHRAWHPFFMWNASSFLFEVFWCVSVYWFITGYEMMPVILERFPFPRLSRFLHEVAPPLVFLGITLSTLHHSSLGSLFMVSPTRLHPLWFSRFIPIQFFASAMGAGLAGLILVAIVHAWLYRRAPDRSVLSGLGAASAILLLVYFAIRVADLTFTGPGRWNYVFGPDAAWESKLFLLELALQVFIPAIVFLAPAGRRSIKGLFIGSVAAVLGLVLHRLDVGIVGFFRDAGQIYVPTLAEIVFSVGVLAAAGLLFLFITERFRVLAPTGERADGDEAPGAADRFSLAELKEILLGTHALRYAVIVVATIPATFGVFSALHQAVRPHQTPSQPVAAALGASEDRADLIIDGNRSGLAVNFGHDFHQGPALRDRIELECQQQSPGDQKCVEKKLCGRCHHLALPNDHATACWRCHRDMDSPTNLFNHHGHQQVLGGKASCQTCHPLDRPKGRGAAKPCLDCHAQTAQAPMAGAADQAAGFSPLAPGYQDAMHGLCLPCHRALGADDMKNPKGLGNCQSCHPQGPAKTTSP